MQHLDRLYLTLQAAQRIAVPPSTALTAKLDSVEAALAPRLAALDEFSQRPNANAHSIVEAFLTERASANMPAAAVVAPQGGGEGVGAGAAEPDASAVYRAIALDPFRRMAAAVLGADPDSKLGRLNAIAAGFSGDCVLSVRMLCEGGRHLSLKHPALARLFDLRSHLAEYFTWCLTADSTGAIPSRLRHYSIDGTLGEMSGGSGPPKPGAPLLAKLLRLELDSIDWLGAPGGLLALKAVRDGGKSSAKSTHPDDIYTLPEAVMGIGEFIHQLLVALGASQTVDQGYTFKSWTDLYIRHLECARKLRTRTLRLSHLDRCHEYYLMSLRNVGQDLKAKIFCAQPDQKVISGPLLTDDDEPIASIKQWEANHEASLNLLHDFRGMFSAAPDEEEADSDLLDAWTLPRRSERRGSSSGGAKDSGRGKSDREGKKRQRDEAEDSGAFIPTEPGSAVWAHMWLSGRSELLISGRVWHVTNLAAKFKTTPHSACWPVLLSARVGDNRLAHCEHVGHADHATLTSSAHRLSGFRPAALLADKTLWRYPTVKEKSMLSEQRVKAQGSPRNPPGAGPKVGRGRGNVGRGAPRRAARGGHGQDFRQLSSLLGGESTA